MITKNIVKQPKSLVEVTVSVPWADLEVSWNQVLQKMSAETEIAGFRKGAAPVNLVEQQLGTRLQDEFLKTVMPQFLMESLKGTEIVPIDYPNYQLTSFVKGQGLEYKATVTNRPLVTVGTYKTIKAIRPAAKQVTDEEVTKVINDLFKRWQAKQGSNPATPAAQPTAQAGSLNFQGNTPTPLSTTPDDNFARAVGGKDLNDLKAQVRKDLEGQVKYNSELDYEEAILQEVEKITQVEIPEILIADELNRMLVSLQRRVADMGLLMEDYLKGQGKTLEQIKTEWRGQAERNVRMELGLAEIARQENVVISDVELQAEIDKIQDARVKQQFDFPEPRLQLRHSLRQVRTLDLLKKIVGV
ncbi:MAG: trigger factor [Candidatus Daviesbacteria bacterium]|nr:trigger factor [Candidatus Daviesbacteria bacterium]